VLYTYFSRSYGNSCAVLLDFQGSSWLCEDAHLRVARVVMICHSHLSNYLHNAWEDLSPLLKSESQHVSFCIHLPILQRTRNDSDILDDIPPTLILSQAHPKRSENYKLDHVSFKRNLCFLSFPLSLHISPSLYIIHVHIYIYICIHTYIHRGT
jgi:hypothetical protein